ncbi:hypothetical protein [Actinoplanes sp. NPDC026619]|uniref:hypothetical protein n=1 Tax=Actinoplanes sp. NPDC026619 TaxID=3155798 RepID=UPI0033E7002D
MSKNRRRSAHRAAVEEQAADAPRDVAQNRRRSAQPLPGEELAPDEELAADVAQSRRRSAWPVAGEEPAADVAEPRRIAANRRRSAQAAPTAGETAEPRTEQLREAALGALSGALPPGSDRAVGEIATDAGHYLRQAARDEAPARFGTPAGDVDDVARRVWEIAFGLVVRRRFEPATPLAEISRTVATAVHEHAAAALPILDAEMLVRHALGETVPVGDIEDGELLAVHLLLFASLADELALVDEELDAIIADAEAKAALVPA